MPAKTILPEKRELERPGDQPLHVTQLTDALLRLKTASNVSGLSIPTLYRKARTDPSFPRLVKMGPRCTRIRAGELMAWLKAQGGE